MSSDSDSDVCDFTSDVSKQMSKGRNQFWQRFNNVLEDHKHEDQEVIIDKENLNITQSSSKSNTKETFNVGINTNQIKVKETTSNAHTANQNINVQNRITNKLNKLSEEIDSIIDNKRRQSQRIKRKQVKKPRKGRKKSNISVPNLTLDDSDAFISDGEINDVISALINSEEGKEQEELNPIVTVNVLWKSVTHNSFKVHKYQALSCILEHYTKTYNVKPELLFFILDDRHIKLEENSFVSLRLKAENQIEGGVLPESCLETSQQCMNFTNTEAEVEFKVRSSEWKCEINVGCKKDDKMEIVFWQVCRHFKQPVENIKLYFRNNVIKPNINISDINLGKGACFDMHILNKPN